MPQTDPSLSAQRARVVASGICALILSVGIARFAYTPLLPVMRAHAGLSAFGGGWLATINYAGYMSGALAASMVRDLGVKFRLYRIGLVLAVLTTTLTGLTQNIWLWSVLRYLSGFSSTAGLLLASGLVLNWLIRHDFKPLLGLHFTGMGLGIILSGVAAEAMARHLGWDVQWQVLGAIAALFFVPAWAWMPSPAAGRANTISAGPPPSRRWMGLLIAAYFCAGVGYVVSATFIVAIVGQLPLMAGKGNYVWMVVGAAALPSAFLWDWATHRWGAVRALLLGYALEVVSIVLPALSAGTVANMLAAALFGGTFVGIVSMMLTLVGRKFPMNPAKAMARLTLSYGVAQIAAPAVAGIMAAGNGNYRPMLYVAAAAMVLGMALLTRIEE